MYITRLLNREIGQTRRIRLRGRSWDFLKGIVGGRCQADRLQLGDDHPVVAGQLGHGSGPNVIKGEPALLGPSGPPGQFPDLEDGDIEEGFTIIRKRRLREL